MTDHMQTLALVETKNKAIDLPLLRVRCWKCCKEVSMQGTIAAMQVLLEHAGWRLGPKPLCRECVKKTARKAMQKVYD